MTRPTVAVIGAGVSGLTAAHVLAKTHAVTLFEAADRLGGHAHTHDVTTEDGRSLAVDSGFIVHNERTYPHLLRLFAELGVETRATEMSMSITCACGLSYAGGRGVRGILAQPRRAADPRFVRMLVEVPRFHREARRVLAAGDAETTWGEFLDGCGFSDYFVRHFALPLVSCVWSSGDSDTRAYPARHLFRFLDHHGMLTVKGSPSWRTVVGGSRTYVDRLTAQLEDVRRGTPITSLTRHEGTVDVVTADGAPQSFDAAVIATHADQALALLADATPAEKEDLSAIGYSVNRTWLHHDSSVLPDRGAARASWNYRMRCDAPAEGVVVSYWMNRLQGLTDSRDHVVTLNAEGHVDEATVVAEMAYAHPIFTTAAVEAASRLRSAGGARLAFAGAHLGWGFHEDGCRSGVEAAAKLGASW
ncbi:NAD(P)/FAD-dependent oxidoreductase [Nocardioides sp.]|uniref:NAD(P)/FAD-dependent oxidoreductase n=1 Tax=Nocardioides sp. TaxID=35761 RepID=UPI002ED3416B